MPSRYACLIIGQSVSNERNFKGFNKETSQQCHGLLSSALRGSVSDTGLTKSVSVPQNFAENTMNELLGWYGYDKVELRDSDNLELGEMPQHISVLKGMYVTR